MYGCAAAEEDSASATVKIYESSSSTGCQKEYLMRSIFVGSSKEALGQAQKIARVIEQAFAGEIHVQEWDEAYRAQVKRI